MNGAKVLHSRPCSVGVTPRVCVPDLVWSQEIQGCQPACLEPYARPFPGWLCQRVFPGTVFPHNLGLVPWRPWEDLTFSLWSQPSGREPRPPWLHCPPTYPTRTPHPHPALSSRPPEPSAGFRKPESCFLLTSPRPLGLFSALAAITCPWL